MLHKIKECYDLENLESRESTIILHYSAGTNPTRRKRKISPPTKHNIECFNAHRAPFTYIDRKFVTERHSSETKTQWIYRICHTNQERLPVFQIPIVPRTRNKDVEHLVALQNQL
jgi:hypothetical protein